MPKKGKQGTRTFLVGYLPYRKFWSHDASCWWFNLILQKSWQMMKCPVYICITSTLFLILCGCSSSYDADLHVRIFWYPRKCAAMSLSTVTPDSWLGVIFFLTTSPFNCSKYWRSDQIAMFVYCFYRNYSYNTSEWFNSKYWTGPIVPYKQIKDIGRVDLNCCVTM